MANKAPNNIKYQPLFIEAIFSPKNGPIFINPSEAPERKITRPIYVNKKPIKIAFTRAFGYLNAAIWKTIKNNTNGTIAKATFAILSNKIAIILAVPSLSAVKDGFL